jgi:hypothetical protein
MGEVMQETFRRPFDETVRVAKPAPESLTGTWKRVLRRAGGNPADEA